jgi:hypothetical protein
MKMKEKNVTGSKSQQKPEFEVNLIIIFLDSDQGR